MKAMRILFACVPIQQNAPPAPKTHVEEAFPAMVVKHTPLALMDIQGQLSQEAQEFKKQFDSMKIALGVDVAEMGIDEACKLLDFAMPQNVFELHGVDDAAFGQLAAKEIA